MPDTSHARMELEAHRAAIDAIDRQLVALINERAGHSLAIRELKPTLGMKLYDPAREGEIFERISAYSEGPLYDQGLREIYETLLKVMKETPSA
ncbi:chorismate mutase [Adlercreutzia sp. ZJ242]|uniref:chorismate mutase n=1 Tax=Adlercreutzia sp. ZJ242 TaxID=2709409 RepID=UPI0013E9C3AD|nr:chorismate mutase [Adlercreutzia sp. ZJ242]